jgi:hypothetical protein
MKTFDLLSGYERVIRANRLNILETQRCEDRCQDINRACTKSIGQISNGIRDLYLEEQLPRERDLMARGLVIPKQMKTKVYNSNSGNSSVPCLPSIPLFNREDQISNIESSNETLPPLACQKERKTQPDKIGFLLPKLIKSRDVDTLTHISGPVVRDFRRGSYSDGRTSHIASTPLKSLNRWSYGVATHFWRPEQFRFNLPEALAQYISSCPDRRKARNYRSYDELTSAFQSKKAKAKAQESLNKQVKEKYCKKSPTFIPSIAKSVEALDVGNDLSVTGTGTTPMSSDMDSRECNDIRSTRTWRQKHARNQFFVVSVVLCLTS